MTIGSILFLIYKLLVILFGNVLLIYLIGLAIYSIIKKINVTKYNKSVADKLKDSNMFTDMFGKMTDEEKAKLEKTGKAETEVKLDLDTLKTTKKTK